MRGAAPLCGLALILLAPACSDGASSPAGSACRAVDGAPDPFPIERMELEGEDDFDEGDATSFAFPEALMDLDLSGRTLRAVDEVVFDDGQVPWTWSDASYVSADVTQTARLVDTPDEQSIDEHYWQDEQWYERSRGGEWIRHDEGNGYEPQYRFADNMRLMMPSSLAIQMQDDLEYTGGVDVDGVTHARYCTRSPYLAWCAVGGRTDLDDRPTGGGAELWVHPDGYVAEMVARSSFSGGRTACWTASVGLDAGAVPGLDAPSPAAPLFESRFGSSPCAGAG